MSLKTPALIIGNRYLFSECKEPFGKGATFLTCALASRVTQSWKNFRLELLVFLCLRTALVELFLGGFDEWQAARSGVHLVSERMPWAAWKPFLTGEHQTCIVQSWLERFCRSRTRAGVARVGWWASFQMFPKSSQTSAHCVEACRQMTQMTPWSNWGHESLGPVGVTWQGRWALVLHLCFGALAAVTFPIVLPDPVAGAMAPLQPTWLWLCVLDIQVDWGIAKGNAREGETKKGDCCLGSELRQPCLWYWWENTPMTVPSSSCKHVLSLLGLTISCPDFDISWAWLYPSHFSILRGTLAQMSAATRNCQKLLCSKNVLCPHFILRTKGTAYNSAPDFSEFNLVSTLFIFLTLDTRLLHTNQKPNGASKGLPVL